MSLSLPRLRAWAALLEFMLAPEVVLLRLDAAGEAEANWVGKREKTVLQASLALGQCGRVCPVLPQPGHPFHQVLGVWKGLLTPSLGLGLLELTFLQLVPSCWG